MATSQYAGPRIFLQYERRQQELLRQTANNFFGGEDKNETTEQTEQSMQNDIRFGAEEAKSDETKTNVRNRTAESSDFY